MQYLRHAYIENIFIIYLKFKFNWLPLYFYLPHLASLPFRSPGGHQSWQCCENQGNSLPVTNSEVLGKLPSIWASVSSSVKWT